MDRLKSISLYTFLGLLAYMPLHIFLSTWIGTSLQVLDFMKILKDVVLVIGFVAIALPSIRAPWLKDFAKDKLIWLIIAYAALTFIMALIKPTHQESELLAIVYNLRFLLFFVYGGLLAQFYRPEWLRRKALQAVLTVGLVVMTFGFIQYMWLPDNALAHVGYARENGVLPAFHIDNKPDLERVMSTLRDPNSYGSYLIILLTISVTYLLRTKDKELKKVLIGLTALAVLNLWFTFSRGAWIGAMAALGSLLALYGTKIRKLRVSRGLIVAVIALLLVVGITGFVARDSYFVKNVILHADESTVLEDPNELRLRFFRESLQAAGEQPLGYGPGTAGLASIRNTEQGVVLNENYYLQLLHEVGILGLLIFVAILIVVFLRLYRILPDPLSLALLVAFIGIGITNMLVHAWSNEAVAYTWWGLAGLVIYRGNSHNGKQQKS